MNKMILSLKTFSFLFLITLLTSCIKPGDPVAALDPPPEKSSHSAIALSVPALFNEVTFVSGLGSPTSMEFAPDGRIFVCEQGGSLRVLKNGSLLGTPFQTFSVDNSGERGLLGLAFDPNYSNNGYVYVYYTATSPNTHNRVSRLTASSTNPDVASPGSELILLDLDALSGATNHNGGALHFGIDGKLYISVGDNATGSNAQTLSNLHGKILRINSDGSIPTDNPFYNSASGKNRAIWNLGLRNPFTFAVQPGTGRIFINDVGQVSWEEINDGKPGVNYGWPSTEGNTNDPNFKGPLYTYSHSDGCAIAGGTFYNPSVTQFPSSYVGSYFFADYCSGWIRKLDVNTGTASNFASGLKSPVDLKVGPEGSLYYLVRGNGGQVIKISYTGNQAPSISNQPSAVSVSTGQNATFFVTATGSSPLSYQWLRNGANVTGAIGSSYTLNNASSADNGARFKVLVSNAFGNVTSNEVVLTVTTNNTPTANILTPVSGGLFSGGETINYSGSGTDPEDGNLPGAAFTWKVDFHHDSHIHPFIAATSGATSGSFTIPTLGETSANVWFRIQLVVKDSKGATHVVTRDILPRKSNLTLTTVPAGLQLTLDAQPVTSPNTFTSVVGISRSIGAVSPQSLGGKNYVFQSWSDGGASIHNVNTPISNQTYTATFVETATGTPLSLEAENFSFNANVPTFVDQDPNFSNGKSIRAVGTGPGSYCEWTLLNVPSGTYNITLVYKSLSTRGIVQTSLDGVTQGGQIDMFNRDGLFQLNAAIGTKTFASSGNKILRLTIVEKNAASSGYGINIDKFILTPTSTTTPTTLILETESMSRISNVTGLIESDPAYSNGQSTKLFGTGLGSYGEWTLPNVPAGNYNVTVYYKSQGTRATVQATMDGVSQGGAVDMYSGIDAWQVPANLGTKNFGAAGNKLFKLTVTGKNSASSNYYMHIDKVVLTPQ